MFFSVGCITATVAGKRSPGQKIIAFPADTKLLGLLDRVAKANRSKFVRDAIVEKLIAMGYNVPSEYIETPSRIGKGGPRKYRIKSEESVTLIADSPGSNVTIKKNLPASPD